MLKLKTITAVALSSALFLSCRKETKVTPSKPKDEGAGESETITRVVITATSGSNISIGTWVDLDGVGGNAPSITGLNLTNSALYSCSIALYDDTKNPVSLVSEEILKEADEHRFHYTSTPSSVVGISILDKDSKNQPLGLLFSATTASTTTSGVLNVNLRHFGEGETKTANITDGESDLEINIPVTVN